MKRYSIRWVHEEMNESEINELEKLYATWSTDQLLETVQNRTKDYDPKAIDLMIAELQYRIIQVPDPILTEDSLLREDENTKGKHLAKWLIPIAIITSPAWLGFTLLPVAPSFAFVILIIGSLTVFPYSCYYHDGGKILHAGIILLLHWTIVLTIYAFLARKRPTETSLAIFAGLSITSIILAHVILNWLGYHMEIDAP
jgi:hypothetical protein